MLSPVAIDGGASGVTGVALVASGGLLISRSSAGRPSLWSVDGGTARPLFQFDVLASTAVWDATSVGAAVWVVYQKPGSAISALALRRSDAAGPQPVTARHPTGVFTRPRFADVPGNAPGVLSPAVIDRSIRLVLFRPAPGGYGDYTVLDTGEQTVEDARLLAAGTGFLLLYKLKAPSGDLPERRGSDGDAVAAGPVLAQPLDRSLRSSGPAAALPIAPVYEFDAALVGGTPTVFATTADGYVLGRVGAAGQWEMQPARSPPLVSPSLLEGAPSLRLAALAHAGTPQAQVLVSAP